MHEKWKLENWAVKNDVFFLFPLGPRVKKPKKPPSESSNSAKDDEKRPRTAFSGAQLARLKVINITCLLIPNNILIYIPFLLLLLYEKCSMSLTKIDIWLRRDDSNWALSLVWMRHKSKFGSKTNGRKLKSHRALRIRLHYSWWHKVCTITQPYRCRRKKKSYRSFNLEIDMSCRISIWIAYLIFTYVLSYWDIEASSSLYARGFVWVNARLFFIIKWVIKATQNVTSIMIIFFL